MFSQIYALLCTFDANWKAESLLECMVVVVLIHPRILNQRGRGACMHVDWATLSYIQLGRENATEWEGTSQATIAFAKINLSRKIQRSQQKQVSEKRNSNRRRTQHFVIYLRRKNATEWEGNFVQARLPETKETNRNYNRCLRKETQIGEEPNTLSYIQFRRKEKEYFLRWTWQRNLKKPRETSVGVKKYE